MSSDAARVDNQRHAHLPGGADVGAKALALPFHVGDAAAALALFHLVVVEARFADGHHLGHLRRGHQFGHAGFVHVLAVGVHAGAGPEVVVLGRQRLHGRKLFHRGADAQRARHPGGGHGGAHAGHVARQFGKSQVAVGIGEHAERNRASEKQAATNASSARQAALSVRAASWAREVRCAQMVCVGRSEPSAAPRICSILTLSCCDFSSFGNRMPTPCVRLPVDLAGVIHATLPATG